jgi:hypothetical protein
MASCNSTTTPMENRLELRKSSNKVPVDATDSRSILGVLRYLLHTQPDLVFVVGYLSRFMEDSCEDHLTTVKRVLWYITGHRSMGSSTPSSKMDQPSLLGTMALIWLATSTHAEAQVVSSSSWAAIRSAGNPPSRGWSLCLHVRWSTWQLRRWRAKASG